MDNIDVELDQLVHQRDGLCGDLRKINKAIYDIMIQKYGKEMETLQRDMHALSTEIGQYTKNIVDCQKLANDATYMQQCIKINNMKDRLLTINEMLYPCNDTCYCCE